VAHSLKNTGKFGEERGRKIENRVTTLWQKDQACQHETYEYSIPVHTTFEKQTAERILSRMTSSGMLRCVTLVRTEVSKERSVSIIRVTRVGEIGTTLAVTSNRCTLRRNKPQILQIQPLVNECTGYDTAEILKL
jgi:hypothetical protein